MLDGVRWVLFDAVGTLIYPDPPVAEVYHAAGRRFGSGLNEDQIQKRFGAALAASQGSGGATSEANEQERWRRIVGQVIDDVGDRQDELFSLLWRHFAEPRHWRVYDDVADTMRQLCGRGCRTGIASNFDSRLKQIASSQSALVTCEVVFVSSEVGYTKPDLRFFRAVELQLGVPPGQIALVGDDEVADVQGAQTAGWRAIRLDRQGKCGAAAIRTLAELL